MKRRSFIKNTAIAAGAATVTFPLIGSTLAQSTEKGVYELRIYSISEAVNAKTTLEEYISKALIPFLGMHNVKVGVFTESVPGEQAKLYCLLAYPNIATYASVQSDFLTDATYLANSKSFDSIAFADKVFTRYETFLMDGIEKFPSLVVPQEAKGIYELRIYENPTDAATKIKIGMFNNEEIAVFNKVGINPVFFGKLLAGQYMPAVVYMVAFKDMEDHDATWAKFNASEEWKTLRAKPEYPAGNVSKIHSILLVPTAYSQLK